MAINDVFVGSANANDVAWYSSRYSSGAQSDPAGASSGGSRVGRGGSWGSVVHYLRSSLRRDYDPSIRYYNLGFRLAHRP